jgi:sulfur carrier protein
VSEPGPVGRGAVTVVQVNGTPWHGPAVITLTQLVAEWSRSPKGIAVALNGEVVPKSLWEVTRLSPGDRVEIVTAAAGG